MDVNETGRRIQQLRKSHGWTQRELAEKLNVTDRAVSKWERGLNFPDMAILEPLAKALGSTVVEILGLENVPQNECVDVVTAVAVKETERIKKETRERAIVGMIMCIMLFVTLLILGRMLIERSVYDLPLNICRGALSIVGFHLGNYLWIWWKYRK